MNCLLLGGSYSVGKSEAIYRATQHLITLGFVDILHLVPPAFFDFIAVLEGLNRNNQPIRIKINTATDTPGLIHNFKNFYNANGNYDILISSVRDHDFWPRKDFFAIMGISHSTHHILEIPLGKVTRKGANFTTALAWHQSQLDNLIKNTLHNNPYNI
jgi:hypothetical protein